MIDANPRRPSVLVVGGGYAGVAAAKALDDVADVVLVEPKDAFVHNVAALRALVEPDWLPRIFLPYDRLLTNGRVVRDRVVRLDSTQATLGSGEEIEADFTVLATGSRYPFPAKSDRESTKEAHARYKAAYHALAGAGRVLIVGAGPVGLELAGEIAAAWPNKCIVITDVAGDILNGPFKPELRSELRRQLADLGVKLVLGSPLRRAPPSQPGQLGTFTVATEAGDEITADIWFRAYGVTPITDYLAGDLLALRTPEGYVQVTPYLQLPGQDRIFAIGDIATIDANMAGRAGRQAQLAASNIRSLITGEGEVSAYEPMPPAIILPLGPTGGAGQRPGVDGIIEAPAIAEIKGRDMMVDRFAEMMGLSEPALKGS